MVPSKEVVMPIRVVAKGRVAEAPVQLQGEDVWVVFVLDPFPGATGARLAHSCEVVCRNRDLPSSALGAVQSGDPVEVTGELVIETIDGPFEDDLSAVRVWIKASDVSIVE
jgi:hypothetical protein